MIEKLIYFTGLITLLVSCQSGTPDTDQLNGFETVLFTTDSTSSVACYRIPALITAANGDLIAAIDERVPSCGDLKKNDDINIVIRRSVDQGLNWTAIERIIDYPIGQSASDPSMIVDSMTGTIYLFFNYMEVANEKDVYYLKLIKSMDHGVTWSLPIDITSQITKPDWHHDFKFITSGRGISTSDGKLLHTIVNLDKGLHVFGSDDHGDTWYLIDTPIHPADESKIVELPDGGWMINSRVNGLGHRYMHTSIDEGQSWTSMPDSTLIDPGCNASILQHTLPDGQTILLLSNAKTVDKRMNMTIRASKDDGKTWTSGQSIFLGSAAYSSMTVLSNGDIGLFYERNAYQENVFVRMPMDSIIAQNK